MAGQALGISGRLEVGETLRVWALEPLTSLQWQALVGGVWVNVGTANSETFTIPSNAVGAAYRLVGTTEGETFMSPVTGLVTLDSKKSNAPVLSGDELAMLGVEGPGERSVFSWLTLTDADRTSFGGGSLLLHNSNSLGNGGDGQDILSIRFASGVNQFSYIAATRELRYTASNGATSTVGTLDATLDGHGADLKVSFNSNATVAIVDALINNLQYRNEDDSPTESRLFTLRVTDGSGASAQRVTAGNIQAEPDAPVFTSATSFEVNENEPVVGVVSAFDPDVEAGQPQGIAYSIVPVEGSVDSSWFAIDAATGELRFVNGPDFESQAHGPQYSVRIRATDSNGGTVEQLVSVTVRDVNDAPIASNLQAAVSEDGPSILIASGAFDPDAGDSLTYAIDTSGTIGAVTLEGTSFRYDPADRFETLRAGMSFQDTFTYTVTDTQGNAVTRTVAVTVEGANDAPIAVTPTGLVSEAGASGTGNAFATGDISVLDVDGDAITFQTSGQGQYGALLLTEGGHWTYVLDNGNPAVQALDEYEMVTDTITVNVQDAQGATTLLPVNVLIFGANDAPTVSDVQFGLGPLIESGLDEAGLLSAAGSVAGSASDPEGGPLYWTPGTQQGQWGALTIDAAGNWRYDVDNALADPLMQGEIAHESFTLTVADSRGATATRGLRFDVRGTNDAPIISGGDTTGLVVEPDSPDGTLVLDWSTSGSTGGEAVAIDTEGRMLLLSTRDMYPNYPIKTLSRFNADGSLDTSYGADGSTTFEWPIMSGNLQVDAQGRALAVGYSALDYGATQVDFAVTRVLADGSLDMSFGVSGTASIDLGGYDYGHELFLRPGGGMFVVGSAGGTVVVALNEDGSVDTSFGADGRWTVPESGFSKQVTMDAQGRFLAWSTESDPDTYANEVHIERYLTDGSVDTSFGVNGAAEIYLPASSVYNTDLAVGPDGGIILGAMVPPYTFSHPHVMLMRVNADGTWDDSFGDYGSVDTQVWGGPNTLRVDGEGRILVAGQVANNIGEPMDFMVARYLADGTIDTSFGDGGQAITDISGAGFDDYVNHLLLGDDGTIVLGGVSNEAEYDPNPAIARYTAEGHLDTSFGVGLDPTISGLIVATDPDAAPGSWEPLQYTAVNEGVYGDFALLVPTYGGWTYTLDNSRAVTQALDEGETATDTITVAIRDAMGGVTYQDIVVTVIGSFDPMVTP